MLQNSTPETRQADAQTQDAHVLPVAQKFQRYFRPVSDLRPNTINSEIFTASLQPPSIEKLADSIALHGLRQPILIRQDGLILDGERRWRAVTHLGWENVEVLVAADDVSDDDVAMTILDAFSSNRDATVEERFNVFQLAKKEFQRLHGRPEGRPSKLASNGASFWTTDKIIERALGIAGLPSKTTAERVAKIFTEGAIALRERVNNGDCSISEAYEEIRRASGTSRRRYLDEPDDAADQSDTMDAGTPGATNGVSVTDEPVDVPQDETTTTPMALAQPEATQGYVADVQAEPEQTVAGDVGRVVTDVAGDADDEPSLDDLVCQLVTKLQSERPQEDEARHILNAVGGSLGIRYWVQLADERKSLQNLGDVVEQEVKRYYVRSLADAEAWVVDLDRRLSGVIERRRRSETDKEGRV